MTGYQSTYPPYDAERKERLTRIRQEFDQDALARVCAMDEADFGEAYGMERVECAGRKGPNDNFYFFKNNNNRVLAVAHLDTVISSHRRGASFAETEAGLVVFSGALDDRLGAYIILELLPKLGFEYDLLLTVGEESGRSTASFFTPPEDNAYDWVIEFDRGGTDVVMYQYENPEARSMVIKSGARMGHGSFSDIGYLEHLGVKAFNWGVGYQDYHGPRGHAFLEDTFEMVSYYMKFHEQNAGTFMIHYKKPKPVYKYRSYGSGLPGVGQVGSSFLGGSEDAPNPHIRLVDDSKDAPIDDSSTDYEWYTEGSSTWKAYVEKVAAQTGLSPEAIEKKILDDGVWPDEIAEAYGVDAVPDQGTIDEVKQEAEIEEEEDAWWQRVRRESLALDAEIEDREYVENPTPEQMNAALAWMDGES